MIVWCVSSTSVIIVSHDSGPLLVECVQSALASSSRIEVFVADNDSHDGSIEAVEALARFDSRLRVLRTGGNLGFAAANNLALRQARGDDVLFLNPDCLVRPDTVGSMAAVLDAHPEAGMAGCLIRNPDGSEEPSDRRTLPTPAGLLGQLLGSAQALASLPVAPAPVEAISGAFMMVRRADLDRIGSFDEGYFLHWEDLDLCQRFRQAGRTILFVPGVEVLHFKGRSSRRRPLWVEWQKHRGLMRYFRKFHFTGWRVLLYPPVALAIVARFLLRAARPVRLVAAEPPLAVESSAGPGQPEIWVFGATSLVGRHLLPRLLAAGYRVRAFTRAPSKADIGVSPRLTLAACDLRDPDSLPTDGTPEAVINLAPIFTFSCAIPALARRGVRKAIAFGSTSALTKADSTEEGERALAQSLAAGEAAVQRECDAVGMRWAILRPTMIYSFGHDRNVTRLARFIDRFGFLVLPGEGRGLRQPVHAGDLADACIDLLASPDGWRRSYDLGGGEVLGYRAMIERICHRLGRPARVVRLPDWLSGSAIAIARRLPAYRDVNPAMLRRVDLDMTFAHDEATRAFGYSPRRFLP